MKNVSHFRAILGLILLLAAGVIAVAQEPELVVQTGHSMYVPFVWFSPDGKFLASASFDGTIKFWDWESGKELRTLPALGVFRPVAFSPDGGTLAVEDWGGIKLWSAERGKVIRTLKGHSDRVWALSFSPDGKTLASGSDDETIRLWDAQNGAELRTLSGRHGRVETVSFSPDGKILASGGKDKTIRLWDVASGSEIRTLSGHAEPVLSLSFSPDGKTLASGSDDKTIKLWDVGSGKESRTLSGHSHSVKSLAFSPDGETLASGGLDTIVKLWRVASGEELRTFFGGTRWVSSFAVAFSPDGKILASGSDRESAIRLWDAASGEELKTLAGHVFNLNSVSLSPDGKALASGDDDVTVKLWDLERGKGLRVLAGHSKPVSKVLFSPDGKLLASKSSDGTIRLWDVESGKGVRILSGKFSVLLSPLTFSPDGSILASDSENSIKIWDVASGKELWTLSGHSSDISSLSFSPDGKTLASGSDDKTIRLWDVASGRELKTLQGHSGDVFTVIFSPSGKALASKGYDDTVRLWDVGSGKEVAAFWEPCKSVWSISFDTGGDTLAVGCYDTIKLWDLRSGKISETLGRFNRAARRRILKQFPGFYEAYEEMSAGEISAVQSGRAEIKLLDRETLKELVTLIALNKTDWVVFDPAGRFDASPNAERLLHYVVRSKEYGYEAINLEQLKWRYYEPGLLRMALKGEQLGRVAPFSNAELYPAVEEIRAEGQTDASPKRSIKLTNRGGGIGPVQVFVNGGEIITDARDEKLKQNPTVKEAVITFDLKAADERLIAGQRPEVMVIVWNYDAQTKEGYISSSGTKLSYSPRNAAPAAQPELYAIIGGVSDYEGNSLDLQFASTDAEDFYKAIEIGGRNLFGVEKMHLKLLATSGSPDAAAPTKANFKKAFEEFAKLARPTDVFLVYLSGHGIALGAGTDSYLYLTKEARTTDTATLSDRALRERVSISSEELTAWHKAVLAQKQVLILDTCAAGAAAARLAEKRPSSSDAIRAIDRMQYRRGFHVLMGSAADAVSYEASQYGQGLLTHALLRGIKSGEALQDGQIDVARLFNFAADQVPVLATYVGGIQRPEIRIPYGGASFPVGFIKNERDKAQIPLAQVRPLILRPVLQNRRLGFDNLKLTALLREALREVSFFKRDGERTVVPKVGFVNADEMPGALMPAGNYTVEGKTIKVTINLIRDDNPVTTFQVTGDTNNPSDLISKLVSRLVATAAAETKPR